MKKFENKGRKVDRRAEPRKILDRYFSVEFSVSRTLPIHQFRVRDISPTGIGIVVNEGSAVLRHLKVGDVLEMTFNPEPPSHMPDTFKTEIRHITRIDRGPYRGHYLVGMRIAGENP